jgi:O-antigen ligase
MSGSAALAAPAGRLARRDDPAIAARADRWTEKLAALILVLTLLWVMFGALTDTVSDPTQTDHVNPLNSWVWLGLLAMAVPILQRRWRETAALVAGCWPLLLLFGYFALSVTWALDPPTSLRRLILTVLQFALMAIVVSGTRRAPVLHMAIALACAAAGLGDAAYGVIAPGAAMTEDGFAGLHTQKNQTGLTMMYGCLAAGPCLFLLRRPAQACLLALTAVMAGVLVVTRSTTSQSLVIAATVVMPLLLLIARLPRRLILAIAAVGVLLPAAGLLAYLAWCGASGTDPLLPTRGATFSERNGIWLFVLDEIAKRPWIGAGFSSFWAINPAVQPSLKSDQWFGVYAIINEGHDGYLDMLATGGVIGLAGALFVLGRAVGLAGLAIARAQPASQAWRDGRMARPTATFHLAFLLALLVHNVTESNLFCNSNLLAVGLLLAVLDLEKWRLAGAR